MTKWVETSGKKQLLQEVLLIKFYTDIESNLSFIGPSLLFLASRFWKKYLLLLDADKEIYC